MKSKRNNNEKINVNLSEILKVLQQLKKAKS